MYPYVVFSAFVLEQTRNCRFMLSLVPSGDNLADMLTKALGPVEFVRQVQRIMVRGK